MTEPEFPSTPVLAPVPVGVPRRRGVAVAALLLGMLAVGTGLGVALAALACAAVAWRGDGLSRLFAVIGASLGVAVVAVFLLPLILSLGR
jgi:hypothetical protein